MSETGVSTSSYPTGPQQGPPNLLGMASQFAGTQNALNQNRLFVQQFQAKQGIGQALSRAADPQTGKIDYNKAALLMASDPRAAGFVPEFINQMAQANNLNAETTLKNIDIAQKQQAYYARGLAPLLAKGNSVTPEDATNQIGIMYANGQGVLDRDHTLSFMASMPRDSVQLANYIRTHQTLAQTNADAMGSVLGQVQNVDTGAGHQITAASPLMGGTKPIGFLPNQPTVSERNAITPTVDAAGNIQNTPRFAAAPMQTGTGEAAAGTGAGATVGKQGTYKTAVLGKMADYKENLDQTVDNMNTTMQQLQEANGLLGKNDGLVPGGGTAVRAKTAQFLQAIGAPQDVTDKVAAGNLSSAQEFAKLMTPIAVGNLRGAVGNGQRIANQEVQLFVQQNPNLDTDPRAVQKMFSLYQRLYKTKALEQSSFSKWAQAAQDGQSLPDGSPVKIENFPAWWTQKLVQHGVVSLQKGGQ